MPSLIGHNMSSVPHTHTINAFEKSNHSLWTNGLFVTPRVIGFEKRRQLRNEKTTKNKREREVIKSIANNIRMTGKKTTRLRRSDQTVLANSIYIREDEYWSISNPDSRRSYLNFSKSTLPQRFLTACKSIFYGKHYCDPITGAQHNPLRLTPSYIL